VVFAEAWGEPQRTAIEAVLKPYRYRATGRVFNSTPTYEFVYEGSPLTQRLRRVARKLPKPVRRILIKARIRPWPSNPGQPPGPLDRIAQVKSRDGAK
jgi:hypothetical protein